MECYKLVILLLSAVVCVSSGTTGLNFPPWFKFGTSTSSYQVEGAWNVSDKSPSIWDHFTQTRPDAIADNSNGNVACDSYHQWKRDVEMASELGLQFYRFSISWPRLLPTGYPNVISEDGKNYYSNLIDSLLENGIEPLVTIYHWDLPQNLQELGGWTNPLIADWFADYARVVYSLYADRVKTWITINEPIIFCDLGYDTGNMAPGIKDPKIAPYLCNKYMLLAHAKAWRIYDKEFKPKYHGKVSLSNNLILYTPQIKKYEELADLAMQFTAGRYSHPIYSDQGGWPPAIERIMARNSLKQGYPRSRLPAFTEEEIKLIRGTYDFYGLNYYTSKMVRPARCGERVSSNVLKGLPELGAVVASYPNDTHSHSELISIHPQGLRYVPAWLKRTYGDFEILITENGYSTKDLSLNDSERIIYIRKHLKQVLLAIKEEGVNVTGYTYWSLMDDFEWADGYTAKFGLYEVDFTDPRRKRTPRASAQYFANVTSSRSLNI